MTTPGPIIDVHCHLTSSDFATDLDAVLERAAAAGVGDMVCVGETAADNTAVLALAARHDAVHAALGHYPAHLDEDMAATTEALIRAHRDDIVAIGEIGIDHWIAKEADERARQHAHFLRFVRLGIELDLPLSVHSRSAGHHALELLREARARRVCLHAFDGKARYGAEAAEAGYFLSIPPSVVRSEQKRKLVRAVPIEHLLIETDAPVLGPDRDARNEPANAARVVETIAELKGMGTDEVRAICHANTLRLFGAALARP